MALDFCVLWENFSSDYCVRIFLAINPFLEDSNFNVSLSLSLSLMLIYLFLKQAV